MPISVNPLRTLPLKLANGRRLSATGAAACLRPAAHVVQSQRGQVAAPRIQSASAASARRSGRWPCAHAADRIQPSANAPSTCNCSRPCGGHRQQFLQPLRGTALRPSRSMRRERQAVAGRGVEVGARAARTAGCGFRRFVLGCQAATRPMVKARFGHHVGSDGPAGSRRCSVRMWVRPSSTSKPSHRPVPAPDGAVVQPQVRQALHRLVQCHRQQRFEALQVLAEALHQRVRRHSRCRSRPAAARRAGASSRAPIPTACSNSGMRVSCHSAGRTAAASFAAIASTGAEAIMDGVVGPQCLRRRASADAPGRTWLQPRASRLGAGAQPAPLGPSMSSRVGRPWRSRSTCWFSAR